MKSNVTALIIATAAFNAITMWLTAIIMGGTFGWITLVFMALWMYPTLRAAEEIERLTAREKAQRELKKLAISEIEEANEL